MEANVSGPSTSAVTRLPAVSGCVEYRRTASMSASAPESLRYSSSAAPRARSLAESESGLVATIGGGVCRLSGGESPTQLTTRSPQRTAIALIPNRVALRYPVVSAHAVVVLRTNAQRV